MKAKKAKKATEKVVITYMVVFPENREDLAKAAHDSVAELKAPLRVLLSSAESVPLTITKISRHGSIVEFTGEAEA